MPDFLISALAAGLMVAAVSGPLGCFVVWRRMAYFGDTLAHSALLGIAFGLLLSINLQLAVIIACLVIALLLVLLDRQQHLATDTILGILAHSSLAFGLVMISFTGVQVDLMAYLFGDLLTVSGEQLLWIGGGVLLTLLVLNLCWKSLLTITLHQELAQVEGLNVARMRVILMLLIASVIALAMNVVGVLLITSLMIIPPATARYFTDSPEKMAVSASFIGCLAVCSGLVASWYLDTPTGPSIVVAAAAFFILTLLAGRRA